MREDVKSLVRTQEPATRRYDNSRRQARVRQTRADVVAAARSLFLSRGYPATTIEAIGLESGVPLATLYRLFGSKRGILTAVLETALVGDDEPASLHERPLARQVLAETDPARRLSGFARLCREVLERSQDLQRVLRSAAAVDAEAAGVLTTISGQRLAGQQRVARSLVASGALAGDMSEDEAGDTIYALMSPEVHQILRVERGWDADHYERWLARSLARVLLAR